MRTAYSFLRILIQIWRSTVALMRDLVEVSTSGSGVCAAASRDEGGLQAQDPPLWDDDDPAIAARRRHRRAIRALRRGGEPPRLLASPGRLLFNAARAAGQAQCEARRASDYGSAPRVWDETEGSRAALTISFLTLVVRIANHFRTGASSGRERDVELAAGFLRHSWIRSASGPPACSRAGRRELRRREPRRALRSGVAVRCRKPLESPRET